MRIRPANPWPSTDSALHSRNHLSVPKPLRLLNGITVNHVPTGTTRINVGLTLGATQGFESDDSSATLDLNGPLNLPGFTLTNQGAVS